MILAAEMAKRVVGFVMDGDNSGCGSNATGAWDDVSATSEVVGVAPAVSARRSTIVGMAM